MTPLGHASILVTDTDVGLPDIPPAARFFMLQVASLGESVTLTLDGTTPVPASHGWKVESGGCFSATLDSLDGVRLIAPADSSAAVQIIYMR
jgi:hypothetical protein